MRLQLSGMEQLIENNQPPNLSLYRGGTAVTIVGQQSGQLWQREIKAAEGRVCELVYIYCHKSPWARLSSYSKWMNKKGWTVSLANIEETIKRTNIIQRRKKKDQLLRENLHMLISDWIPFPLRSTEHWQYCCDLYLWSCEYVLLNCKNKAGASESLLILNLEGSVLLLVSIQHFFKSSFNLILNVYLGVSVDSLKI